MIYSIGDKVVHPMHGAGIIDGTIEKRINGVTRKYYKLKLFSNSMQVLIPIESSEQIGVRPIIDENTADNIIRSIDSIEVVPENNWSKRYRDNMLHLKSGDLMQVALVVKSLTKRDSEKGLSSGERKMLNSAKQILISEIVLAKSANYEDIEEKVNKAMNMPSNGYIN